MHGIQHVLRQHAVEKQNSTDSWHSAQSAISSQLHLQQYYGASPNARVNDVRTLSTDSSDSSFNQGELILLSNLFFVTISFFCTFFLSLELLCQSFLSHFPLLNVLIHFLVLIKYFLVWKMRCCYFVEVVVLFK